MFFQELKTHRRQRLLIIAFIALFLSLLAYLYHTQNLNQKSISKSKVVANKTSPVLPVRLKIPKINVDASIEYVGVTSKGAMEVPDNAVSVGWFKLGPRPGEKGSAVIAGHFDGKNGEAGVFIDLYKLNKGDKLYIEDDKGASITFVVRESRIYDPGYADDVFSASESARLNLITCDGVWNGVKKSYSKRLVIFTDIIH